MRVHPKQTVPRVIIKRRWFHKPFLVFTVIFRLYLRQLVSILIPQQNQESYQYLSVNKLIPGSLAIRSAGTHLYSIGLSAHKPFNAPKRRSFHKPIVVFVSILSQFILRQLVSILIPQQNPVLCNHW